MCPLVIIIRVTFLMIIKVILFPSEALKVPYVPAAYIKYILYVPAVYYI